MRTSALSGVPSFSIRMQLVFVAGVVASSCGGGGATSPPAAVRPPIDSVTRGNSRFLVGPTITCRNVGLASPQLGADQYMLWFRGVPAPSGIDVAIDGDVLQQVPWGSQFSGAAYQVDINLGVTPTLWRVLVNPNRQRPYVLRIRNVSANGTLTGTARISNPTVLMFDFGGGAPPPPCNESGAVPGGRIAFTSDRDGTPEVFVVRADETWGGQFLTKLTNAAANFTPSISGSAPNATIAPFVAYESNRSGNGDIFRRQLGGSESTTGAHPGRDSHPTVADGGAVAYVFNGDIWVGNTQVSATVHADTAPNFCRNGSRIAFMRNNKVATMNSDGSAATVITTGSSVEATPVFNRDCTKIAFIRDNQLWMMDATGANATSLGVAGVVDRKPSFSANSDMIAVESQTASGTDIYIVNVAAQNRMQVTSTGNNTQPVFGPGDRVAFVSTRDGNKEIYTVRANGLGLVRITQHAATDEHPSWR